MAREANWISARGSGEARITLSVPSATVIPASEHQIEARDAEAAHGVIPAAAHGRDARLGEPGSLLGGNEREVYGEVRLHVVDDPIDVTAPGALDRRLPVGRRLGDVKRQDSAEGADVRRYLGQCFVDQVVGADQRKACSCPDDRGDLCECLGAQSAEVGSQRLRRLGTIGTEPAEGDGRNRSARGHPLTEVDAGSTSFAKVDERPRPADDHLIEGR